MSNNPTFKIELLRDLPAYRAGLVFEKKDDLFQGGTHYGWWFNGAPLESDSWIARLLDIHVKANIDTQWFKDISADSKGDANGQNNGQETT